MTDETATHVRNVLEVAGVLENIDARAEHVKALRAAAVHLQDLAKERDEAQRQVVGLESLSDVLVDALTAKSTRIKTLLARLEVRRNNNDD